MTQNAARARELLVIGTAVTWAMAFEKGADAAFRRRTEDVLLDAVKQWRDGGMAGLDRDPAVIARRAANAKVAASEATPAKAKRSRRRSRK